MFLSHTIVFLALLLTALVYYRLAKRYQITDTPNSRSSHEQVTVRGGGIIFPAAVVMWWMAFDFPNTWMVIGLVLISSVSLLDDINPLSSRLRFGVQFIALTLAFHDLGVFQEMTWYYLPVFYFIALGVINAINFMDGINGITGLYGLTFFGSLWAVNQYTGLFDLNLIRYEILAISVFLLFNLRKKAIMFAGDIGSISIAYLMIYFLTEWYLKEGNWTIILFLVIYGTDVFLTIAQRLRNGENVLKPHRSHLYQILANQFKQDHVIIALIYAVLQLGLNFGFFIFSQTSPDPYTASIILIGMGLAYLVLKYFLLKKNSKNQEVK